MPGPSLHASRSSRFTFRSREFAIAEEVNGLIDDPRVIHDKSVPARDGEKVCHSFQPGLLKRDFAVTVTAKQPRKWANCLVPADNTDDIVNGSQFRDNPTGPRPKLLTSKPGGGSEQLTVSEPVSQLTALIRRRQHHHVAQVDVEFVTSKKCSDNQST